MSPNQRKTLDPINDVSDIQADDSSAASNETSNHKSRGRKKILSGPPYLCDFPNCNKSFQRSEHLSRHKLNHNPKKIFKCNHLDCGKTFVRHDLLIRHVKRHENKIQKQKQNLKSNEFLSNVVSNNLKKEKTNQFKSSRSYNDSLISAKEIVRQHSETFEIEDNSHPNLNIQPPHSNNEFNYSSNSGSHSPSTHFPSNTKNMGLPSNSCDQTNLTSSNASAANIFQTPNLFNWLFTDSNILKNPGNLMENINDTNTATANTNYHEKEHAPFSSHDLLNTYQSPQQPNVSKRQQQLPPLELPPVQSEPEQRPHHSNISAVNQNSNLDTFSSDFLNEFNLDNNNTQNFFIVQDHFSPILYNSTNNTTTIKGAADAQNDNQLNAPLMENSASYSSNYTTPTNRSYQSENDSFNRINDDLRSFQHSQGQQLTNSVLKHKRHKPSEDLLHSLTDTQMKVFENLIPELKDNIDFTRLKFEKCLKTYWNFFHPRFPMLHRPTFNSTKSPDLLLLSMILLGSKLFMCVDNVTCPDEHKILQPKKLSDIICEPLRWLLFASPFFQPPAEIWIIQSLLMIEFYEKNCSNRMFHERAHLHHGTTIQLLRRSPTLGGPLKKINNGDAESDSENDEISAENENWYKWIESESLKRATFMCFYLDAIDAINMGHQMFIFSHQIQMTMPVEDFIWESDFNEFNKNINTFERPQQFLLVLKNLMNGKAQKTNSFNKKILLAGLNAILFQIQQRDLQLFFGLDKFAESISGNWRDLLTAAFSIWRNDIGSSCCSSKTAINNLNSLGNSAQFSTSDTRCKCISYHIAHIYMSISHYDIDIICGAPWRMNVKPSSRFERQLIKKRVMDWSKTRHCEISIVQCYLALFEMFLSPQDSTFEYQYDYLPDADLFFRSYSIGYILKVLWSYLYVKGEFQNKNGKRMEIEMNGYQYLKNIRNQFTLKSEGILLHTWYNNEKSGSEIYGDLMKWVNALPEVECLGNIIGLLDLVGNKLKNADYAVCKENGNLLLFCKDRALGLTNDEILEDMYVLQ